MADEKQKKSARMLKLFGILLITVGISSDMLGLGSSSIFGYKQIILTVVGLIAVIIGIKCGKSSSKA